MRQDLDAQGPLQPWGALTRHCLRGACPSAQGCPSGPAQPARRVCTECSMRPCLQLAGVVTNLLAGLMGAKWGIKSTLLTGLSLQLVGIGMLFAWQVRACRAAQPAGTRRPQPGSAAAQPLLTAAAARPATLPGPARFAAAAPNSWAGRCGCALPLPALARRPHKAAPPQACPSGRTLGARPRPSST